MANDLFSYTNRDYESSRLEGLSKIPIYSNNTWTDTNISDPGVIILNYVHALVDMIQFYQDHNALEVYLSTAKERKNIFKLAKQLGYEINSSKGSTVDVVVTIEKPYDTSFIIPKNTKVSTEGDPSIEYLTIEDTVVYTGQETVTIPCVQGSIGNLTYKGTGTSSLDNSYDPKDQIVELPANGIDISSITISDNSGELWSATHFIVLSGKDEKVFEPVLSHDGKVYIQFGSGERGYSPKTVDELYISYQYNLGSEGRVGAGQLTSIMTQDIVGADGTPITNLTVTNLVNSIGGTDPESSSEIVKKAPSVIKTNDRAVTLQDYEVLAKKVPGVKEAVAYDIKNDPTCMYYEVKLLVIPEGDYLSYDDEETALDPSLKNAVYDYLSSRIIPPIVLSVLYPSYYPVDIKSKIIIESNYFEDDVSYNVNKKLEEYFNNLASEIGVRIIPNEIISLISSVKGVRYVETLEPSEVIEIPNQTVATLGNVDLTIVRRNS